MIKTNNQPDLEVVKNLTRLSDTDPRFWEFREQNTRTHSHSFFQYPAMMVPAMQGRLIEAISSSTKVSSVADPFVGSGTVLTETMLRGFDFFGQDINPLAILLCKAKAGPFFTSALSEKSESLLSNIESDKSIRLETSFSGRDKWFRRDVAIVLSRIRRSIRKEKSVWARRLFWIALADTVRRNSNSRMSTFKLHKRPDDELSDRTLSPLNSFRLALSRIQSSVESQEKLMLERGYLNRGRYSASVELSIGDSKNCLSTDVQADLLLTSPPYGDGKTTVPYGQYSYLPLQWIDLEDIDSCIDDSYLCSTHEIDSRSLGGSKKCTESDYDEVSSKSQSAQKILDKLSSEPRDRTQRVLAFLRDLDSSLTYAESLLRPGGFSIWITGNRRVGGKLVPLDDILCEFLTSRNSTEVTRIRRQIPSKRMASRNSVSDTMTRETILVMRKS